MNTKRSYTMKKVDMLLTASTIAQNAIANKEFLQSKRSTWNGQFFEDLNEEIENVIQNHLGIDSARDLRQATHEVYAIQAVAMNLLSEAKIQISEDFKKDTQRRDEVLNTLGFKNYFTAAGRNKDQEALVNLLFQFKANLTPQLKTEIIGKGTAAGTLDQIIAQADILKNSNVVQEMNKGSRKIVTAVSQTAFNDIYDKVISICKISRNFYKGDAARQDMFSFGKVAKTMNYQKAPKLPEV